MKHDDHDDQEPGSATAARGIGAHPVSTSVGAVAGGIAAGAAAGSVAGPLGTIAGAATGAILGGMAGKAIGVAVDPTAEEAYWKKAYSKESYFQSGLTYDDYASAYRTGYQGRTQFAGRKFADVERDLEASYNRSKGTSGLSWDKAKRATRAAWDRVERVVPGDLDRDGL